jgi:hypothetical protein
MEQNDVWLIGLEPAIGINAALHLRDRPTRVTLVVRMWDGTLAALPGTHEVNDIAVV